MKIKIGFLVDVFPVTVQVFAYEIPSLLIQKGWDVRIFCSKINNYKTIWEKPSDKFLLVISKVKKLHAISNWIIGVFWLITYTPMWLFSPKLRTFFKKTVIKSANPKSAIWRTISFMPILHFNPNILIVQDYFLAKRFYEQLISYPGKVIISLRGNDINVYPLTQPDWIFILNGLAKSPNIWFQSVSHALKDVAINLGIAKEKIFVIHQGICVDEFTLKAKLQFQSPVKLATNGRLTWEKGYPYTLQSVYLLKQKGIDVNYEIIGTGPEYDHLLYLIHKLGIDKNVTLSGELAHSIIKQKLLESDIYLQPSLIEGIPRTLTEAMASGLPTIATYTGGHKEVVQDKHTGILVETANPQRIAESIEYLISNPDQARNIANSGRNFIFNEFNTENEISEMEINYTSIMESF